MKNILAGLFAGSAILFVGLGCSSINPLGGQEASNTATTENKSLTDKAVDTAVGESKIGVPECDEVADMLTAFANDPNDNWVVKGAKSMAANRIKDALKTSIEENQTDKAQLAKDCVELKVELQKAMQDQKEKANP
jgi:hypothetical protein